MFLMILKSFYLEERIYIPIDRIPKKIKDAFKKISTNKKKIIVIFGSLYLVGNVLSKN